MVTNKFCKQLQVAQAKLFGYNKVVVKLLGVKKKAMYVV
jgi:hypothetical protein